MTEKPSAQFITKHKDAACSIALTLIAFAVRIKGLSVDGLWFDEVYSVRIVRLSVGQIIRLTSGDVHPPLYYLLLHFWTKCFGESESAVRMLSVLFFRVDDLRFLSSRLATLQSAHRGFCSAVHDAFAAAGLLCPGSAHVRAVYLARSDIMLFFRVLV